MKKLTLLFVFGSLFVFSTPLVWGQGIVYSPADFNVMLESYKLKLTDPQKCPPGYVTAIEKDKYTFGTTPIAYSPADANALLEAYGLKLTDPSKCPSGFVTAVEKDKYTFGTTPTAYPDYNGMLEAYGVKIAK